MRNLALAWLHGGAIFLAAMLLFAAQPMVGKLVLPLLGGTPGVWNTCMVFYQAALLGGYAYAHGGSRRLSFAMQYLLHALGLGLACGMLPIALPVDLSPPGAGGLAPPLWLFGVLAGAAGLPMVCLSATAPLLQRWFSLSGHPRARDPYFLYAASNAGSLVGLLAYPWAIEPWLSLPHQLQAWRFGFGLLAVLILASGGAIARAQRPLRSPPPPGGRGPEGSPVAGVDSPGHGVPGTNNARGWPALLRWSALAAIPSSWLLGVTTYITTDLAAIPMLWTIPLALYLVTYILAFGKGAGRATSLAIALLPLVAVPLVMILAAGFVHLFWMPLHLLAFFLGALLCHGRIAATRPPADRATAFYLVIAAGGVLGGLFNALVAPMVFDRLVEYPLAIVLGCLASPGVGAGKTQRSSRSRDLGPILDVALPLAVAGLTALLVTGPPGLVDTVPGMLGVTLAAGLGVYACITGLRRPRRFAMTAAGVLLASGLAREPGGTVLLRSRDFFGTLRVLDDRAAGAHRLLQGSTLHGQQSLDPALRGEPTAYFARTGPIGDVFAAVASSSSRRTGIVGLGAGTLACYARPDESWTFHEIDPAVPVIAGNAEYFTYLSDARSRGASIDIVLGDARLRLREAAEAGYRVLVLDAFSSDAVPVHLLTREAIRLYLTKLDPHGLLVFNISNRYLDLDPLMALQAADAGLVCRIRYDVKIDDAERRAGKQPSIWAVMARSDSDLGPIVGDERWRAPTPRAGARPWTDDRSDLASYLVLGGRRLTAARPDR
ncbi:spermidine synthase [Aquisphaera insulae]|uniref:spermidine synthase n=1 Tax=Aquisphaera insulae TaxID=2712864 RepID=UPI0013EDC4DC|nr:fused MFS/spermidine synthase [Aquisphaera insulae]